MRLKVTWAARNPVPNPKGLIDKLGGRDELGIPWEDSGMNVMYNIGENIESYYIMVDGREADLILKREGDDIRYLTTTADTPTRSPLWELPNPIDPNDHRISV